MQKNITFEAYFLTLPEAAQQKLAQIRELTKKLVPNLTETFSYGIPTFDYKGKHLLHIAGYAHHIGLYPGAAIMEDFKEKLSGYKTSKGTIQFELNKPLPIELITDIIIACKEKLDGIVK